MKKWKTVSSKVILDHPRMKVVEDVVELPNGKITDYVRFESRGNSASIICVNNEKKFLLQKEYSYPSDTVVIQLPGGFVDFKENIEEGANRELMEESNYRANKLILLGSYLPNNRKSKSLCYVFLATNLVKEAKQKDEQEFIENFWVSEEEIDEMIKNNEIKEGNMLAAWSLYKSKKELG